MAPADHHQPPHARGVSAPAGVLPYTLDISDPRNEQDIKAYLARELPPSVAPDIADRIAEKTGGLFLYATWVVAELKSGRLSLDRLDKFPKGLGGAYLDLFERQFPDVSEWDARARPALEVVVAAQEPLSLKQLAAVFGWSVHEERKFRQLLNPLFSFDRGITPFHRSVTDWLTDEGKQDPYFVSVEEGHRILAESGWADYKAGKWSPYLLSYLPVHLAMAGRVHKLEALLADLDFIGAAWEADQFKLLANFALIESETNLKIGDIFGRLDLAANAANGKGMLAVASILAVRGPFAEAVRVLEFTTDLFRSNGDLHSLSLSLSSHAYALLAKADWERPMQLAREQEAICRKLGDDAGLLKALYLQGLILTVTGDMATAMPVLLDMHRIALGAGDMPHVSKALVWQAMATMSLTFDIGQVMKLIKEAEQIDREHGLREELIWCRIMEGYALLFSGDGAGAIEKFSKAEQIAREFGEQELYLNAMVFRGDTLQTFGRLDEAAALFDEVIKLSRERGFYYGLAMGLNGQARVLLQRGRLDEAMALCKEAEGMFLAMGQKRELQRCLGDQAVIRAIKGDREGAKQLFGEQEAICRELGLKMELHLSRDLQKKFLA